MPQHQTTIEQVIAHLDKSIRDLMLERDALASLLPKRERAKSSRRIPSTKELLEGKR